MGKLVSVIIPVYNGERFIAETIRSVIGQSYADWELVVVDDGSTDGTAERCLSFTSDNRIRLIQQKNAGVSAARNKGIAGAKGEYLAFLDADDVWTTENLSEKVSYLDHYPDIALVHSDAEYIDEDSCSTGFVNKGREGDLLEGLLLWDGTQVNCPSSILVRKGTIEKAGGFDTAFSTAADQDLYFRIAAIARMGRIAKPLVRYRVHGNNMSANIERMERDHLGVYRKAARNGLFRSFWFRQKCFSNLYIILAGSWWHNGKSKIRGMYFLLRAFLSYPLNTGRILKKLF